MSDATSMPTEYDDDILGDVLNEVLNLDGTPCRRVYSLVYPPIGFFPFAATGNGDYHGFYWPIGREEFPAIVAYSSHDAYALIPEHGDLPAAGRCQLARDPDRELNHEFLSAFAAADIPLPTLDFLETIAVDDHERLLELDPNSPFRHCAVADQLVANQKLGLAEFHFRKAIELLPEYGAAHFGLGYLLRRLRRQTEASIYLRRALICPLAFWGGCFWADHILPGTFRNDWSRKALMWLQGIKEPDSSLRDDPFISRIDEISLQTGEAKSRDLEVLMVLIDEYTKKNQVFDALYLWMLVGDRAALETTSFRERYELTPASFGQRLLELYRAAGLERRAALLQNMLSLLEKPDGLYL